MSVAPFLVGFFVLVGAAFALLGSIGLLSLPDFYSRLHGPTKASTLGVGSVLLASSIYFSTHSDQVSLNELLVVGFLFLTAPVSAHLLAKAALHQRISHRSGGGVELPKEPEA